MKTLLLSGPKKGETYIMISGTDTNSVLISVFYWINTFNKDIPGWQIKSQANGGIIKALVQKGFYLPNTIVEVKNYKGLSITHSSRDQT